MNTTVPRVVAALAVMMIASAALISCGPKEDPEIAVSGVTLNQSTITLEPGGMVNLTATVSPSNATDKTVNWSTSNQSVATVSGGTVTAVGEGTATITATASGKTASCTVTVNKKVIGVSSVALDKAEAELEPGATLILAATVKPDDATDKTVTWSSSDDKVATVKDGTVTAVAAGTATITAKAGGKEATCKVTVKKDVESIELDKTEAELEPGATLTLTATVKPDDTTEKTVTWTSSDETVATVEDGTITAKAEGTATITAKAGGKEAACKVTVKKDVESIELDKTEAELEIDGTLTLTATVKPDDATDQTVTWTSGDEAIATVKDGTITAKAVGTVTITATAGNKEATCTVTVIPKEEDRIKAALMKIYDAMDGPNWKFRDGKWDPSKPLGSWHGVEWEPASKELHLYFNGDFGLKGEFPDCFDGLTSCVWFFLNNETGVTGTLPTSFSRLNRLELFEITNTSMTGLPDVFGDMPLEGVFIAGNESMTGPFPETLGGSKKLASLHFAGNNFTGVIPDSWAGLGSVLTVRGEPSLPETVPESFLAAEESGYLINMYLHNSVYTEKPVVVGDYDIPAFWPKAGLKDIVTGETIPYKKVVSGSKVTVLLSWATWCPFSKALLPSLIKMYDKYHKDGLEIIARQVYDSDYSREAIKDYIIDHGYDRWHNFTDDDLSIVELECFSDGGTPSAKVVDNKGNLLFCGLTNVIDRARNRFGYPASTDLIPMLEEIFGPLDEEDDYSSTDYSQDGKVMTLQKAKFGKGINLVFMGDAYTDRDMGKDGLYETVMRQSMEEFFAVEPYKTFRERFNVYAVKVVSKNGRTGDGYSTALGVQVTSSSISAGSDKCYEYALKVPAIKDKKNLTIGVIVNSRYDRGIADMSVSHQSGVGFYASSDNDPELFGATLRHEVGGHAFAFLADEYFTQSGSPGKDFIKDSNSKYEKYGWHSNIDFTDDPKKVKWSMFLSDKRYKDEVGIFEGGGNFKKGVFRPSESSIMKDDMGYFNAPSRWAIYKRIMELSGETASFDKFVEYDAVNRGKK